MAFADKSKELREEFNLTQLQLAQKLHISRACISMIEIGRNEPTANTLLAYANFFGVSVDELLGRDELSPEERAAGARGNIKRSKTPRRESGGSAGNNKKEHNAHRGRYALCIPTNR